MTMPIEATQFKKGDTPWNKGITGYMGANVTSFRLGNLPHNTRGAGTIRITRDGYLEVKLDGCKRWEALHKLIYKSLVGDLPQGYIVIFKDGDKLNLRSSNLLAISRGDLVVMNKSFSNDPAEIKETRVAQIRLKRAIRKAKQ